MEDSELIKKLLEAIENLQDDIRWWQGVFDEEIKANKSKIKITNIEYLKCIFSTYIEAWRDYRDFQIIRADHKKTLREAKASKNEFIKDLRLILKSKMKEHNKVMSTASRRHIEQFEPIKLRIWAIILHSILKIFRIIADVFSDTLPGMMNIKTSGSQRTMNVLQNIAKTGRSVTVDEIMWLSRDALFKNASNITNIKTAIDMKSNIGVPFFVNFGDKITYKATSNTGETAYTIQSRLSPFASKK